MRMRKLLGVGANWCRGSRAAATLVTLSERWAGIPTKYLRRRALSATVRAVGCAVLLVLTTLGFFAPLGPIVFLMSSLFLVLNAAGAAYWWTRFSRSA
jgi:hypothetical protein